MIDTAVILATGNPMHHSQLIQDRPLAMLPALGKPMVVRVMDPLYRAGIRHFFIVVGVIEGTVASYVNNQWVPDTEVEFILKTEQEQLADVLGKLARRLDTPFLITSYNSFTYDRFVKTLLRHHEEYAVELILSGAHQTLSRASSHHYAVMEGQQITGITNTQSQAADMSYILTDLAVCGSHFVDYLAGTPFDRQVRFNTYFMDLAAHYLSQPDAQATIAETSWVLKIEQDEDLLTLNRLLLDEGSDAHILSEIPDDVRIVPPVRIDPQVVVGSTTVIGPHVYLERGSRIGTGVTISDAIVLGNGFVESGSELNHAVVSSSGRVT